AIDALALPLGERMRRQGLRRAAHYSRPAWRAEFGRIVEQVLHTPARVGREIVEVQPRAETRTVRAGLGTALIPVRLRTQGTLPAVPEGPGRTVLRSRVVGAEGQAAGVDGPATALPVLLQPGKELTAAVPVPVPQTPGKYAVRLWAERESRLPGAPEAHAEAELTLVVTGQEQPGPDRCCAPLL